MTTKARLFATAMLVAALSAATVAQAAEYRFAHLQPGDLVLDHPDDMSATAEGPPSAQVATTRFRRGDALVILITALVDPPNPKPEDIAPERIHAILQDASAFDAAQAVEEKLVVKDFHKGKIYGSWFSATDRAPPPGEYRYMSQGLARLDGLILNFRVLSHEDPEGSRELLLRMVESARLIAR